VHRDRPNGDNEGRFFKGNLDRNPSGGSVSWQSKIERSQDAMNFPATGKTQQKPFKLQPERNAVLSARCIPESKRQERDNASQNGEEYFMPAMFERMFTLASPPNPEKMLSIFGMTTGHADCPRTATTRTNNGYAMALATLSRSFFGHEGTRQVVGKCARLILSVPDPDQPR
jgi:hypothetical protein